MPDLTPEQASAEAAHKAKSAQMAVEVAREIHQAELVGQTKEALMEALQEVFGKGDDVGSGEMNILVRRIPLICQDIKNMSVSIEKINANVSRVVWIIIVAVVGALLKLVLIP